MSKRRLMDVAYCFGGALNQFPSLYNASLLMNVQKDILWMLKRRYCQRLLRKLMSSVGDISVMSCFVVVVVVTYFCVSDVRVLIGLR